MTSNTFILRRWQMSDLHDLVRNANNPKIAANLTDRFPYPYTEASGRKFIQMTQENDMSDIYCIEVEGEASGGIGLHFLEDVFRTNVEIGYWLAEQHWGKGIITEAIKQIVEIAFQKEDIYRVFARPYGSNKASHRVLEKAGFALEATFEKTLLKNGVFQDELVYGIRKPIS